MPRGYPNSKASLASAPPRKKRSFFSSALPILGIVRPPSPPRAVPSDRVLAALQPDTSAVIAAANFVNNESGEEKYEIKDKARVTQSAGAIKKVIKKTLPVSKRIGRIQRKVPSAKITAKRVALGSGSTIAQRLKEKSKDKGEGGPRKIILRSRTAPSATESTPTPVVTVAAPPPPSTATPPETKAVPVSKAKPAVKFRLSLSVSESTPPIASSSSNSSQEPKEVNPFKKKEFMDMGLYCQDAEPADEAQLVERVLFHKGYRRPGRPRKSIQYLPPIPTPENQPVSFPPLPLDFGYVRFFGQEHEFALPYYMLWERESGALDGKKRPPFFAKIRTNSFCERPKRVAEDPAKCRCDPATSDCGDNCFNRIMSYLCGKDCPCGDRCGNKSLARRKAKTYKIAWTGARGFGVFAGENISGGDFVMDYRGEIIDMNTFIERIGSEYKGSRNFYALHYDGDEVIDAGLRGNDARFINHGCNPNLEVRKYQTLGDGFEEYEVGFWATRDIQAGEELLYDYNFDSFSAVGDLTADESRVKCRCGAPNCIGYMGRKSGEKSAKEIAKDLEAKAAEVARKAEARTKRAATIESRRQSTVASIAEATPAPAASSSSGVKRGVGRPRKISEEPVIKRGPGRPRKEPLPLEPGQKRGPGRPRIHPLPDPNVPRRKPGRPRKNPLPDEIEVKLERDSEIGPIRIASTSERPTPYPIKRGPGRPRKHPLPEPPVKRGPGRPRKIRLPEDDLPVLGPRITPKQAEKAKRNGAPAGWAYLPVALPAGGAAAAAAAAADAAVMPPPPPPGSSVSARSARAERLASVRLGTPAD